jgi:hypothetical protein
MTQDYETTMTRYYLHRIERDSVNLLHLIPHYRKVWAWARDKVTLSSYYLDIVTQYLVSQHLLERSRPVTFGHRAPEIDSGRLNRHQKFMARQLLNNLFQVDLLMSVIDPDVEQDYPAWFQAYTVKASDYLRAVVDKLYGYRTVQNRRDGDGDTRDQDHVRQKVANLDRYQRELERLTEDPSIKYPCWWSSKLAVVSEEMKALTNYLRFTLESD